MHFKFMYKCNTQECAEAVTVTSRKATLSKVNHVFDLYFIPL